MLISKQKNLLIIQQTLTLSFHIPNPKYKTFSKNQINQFVPLSFLFFLALFACYSQKSWAPTKKNAARSQTQREEHKKRAQGGGELTTSWLHKEYFRPPPLGHSFYSGSLGPSLLWSINSPITCTSLFSITCFLINP